MLFVVSRAAVFVERAALNGERVGDGVGTIEGWDDRRMTTDDAFFRITSLHETMVAPRAPSM